MASKCASCGAPIIWVEMPSGKKMPVDEKGEMLAILSPDNKRAMMRRAHKSHFATCPNASKHRKES